MTNPASDGSFWVSIFGDESQYFTWLLVLIGWGVAYVFIRIQCSDNKKQALDERKINSHNERVALFKEKISLFESSCLDFWSVKTPNDPDPQLVLLKLASSLKVLTETATDIKMFGGVDYPKQLFKTLRRFSTSDTELVNRPLKLDSLHISTIRMTCAALRKLYKLK
ncbi:hypothetical protein JAF94_000722 [Citrobacter braakii]|nr:hypothetical protein [Citrobacter braakii]